MDSWKGGVEPALLRPVLESLEQTGTDLLPPLALVAGQSVELDPDELHGALRRSLLLLAAGGDPERGLILDGRAVTALADELDSPARRESLGAGLAALGRAAAGLEAVGAAVDGLAAEPDLAWRAFACALLADELGRE